VQSLSLLLLLRERFVPLLGLCADLIFSRTCFIPTISSCILPLWCWASSNSSAARSYTFSAMRSASSSVIVYSGGLLMHLGLLVCPPMCIISRLGGLVSCGVVAKGVSCHCSVPHPLFLLSWGSVLFLFLCILRCTPLLLLHHILVGFPRLRWIFGCSGVTCRCLG
jgi:hypothetical protein